MKRGMWTTFALATMLGAAQAKSSTIDGLVKSHDCAGLKSLVEQLQKAVKQTSDLHGTLAALPAKIRNGYAIVTFRGPFLTLADLPPHILRALALEYGNASAAYASKQCEAEKKAE